MNPTSIGRWAFPASLLAALGLNVRAIAQSAGPDATIGLITSVTNFTPVEGVRAYSFGTAICNIGDAPLAADAVSPNHALIGFALYRLHGGRLEQLGVSWLRHGICALQQNICTPCQPVGGGCASGLGPGCADSLTASGNGYQPSLGPRFEVDPASGEFAYPFTGAGQSGDSIFKRLQVREDDLAVAGAMFFVEAQVVHPDDAAAGNTANNFSYRRVNVGPTFLLSLQGDTHAQNAAVFAWRDHGMGPNTPDPSVVIAPADVPGDGRFLVAARATDNGDGTWRYEYAVENVSSALAAGSFFVPLPPSATVTGAGFGDVTYHSGEPFDGADWPIEVSSAGILWRTVQPHGAEPDGNALRWGTMYNFWFDCDVPPAPDGEVEIAMFAPAQPGSVAVAITAPMLPACVCDFIPGGGVTSADFFEFFGAFFGDPPDADINGDGSTDTADFFAFFACFFDQPGAGC